MKLRNFVFNLKFKYIAIFLFIVMLFMLFSGNAPSITSILKIPILGMEGGIVIIAFVAFFIAIPKVGNLSLSDFIKRDESYDCEKRIYFR